MSERDPQPSQPDPRDVDPNAETAAHAGDVPHAMGGGMAHAGELSEWGTRTGAFEPPGGAPPPHQADPFESVVGGRTIIAPEIEDHRAAEPGQVTLEMVQQQIAQLVREHQQRSKRRFGCVSPI